MPLRQSPSTWLPTELPSANLTPNGVIFSSMGGPGWSFSTRPSRGVGDFRTLGQECLWPAREYGKNGRLAALLGGPLLAGRHPGAVFVVPRQRQRGRL